MSDIWAPPSAQQYPAQPSGGVDRLMDRIRRLEGLVAEITKGSPLRQAGMGVSPGQVDFDGNVVISGTLSLPAGIIDNEALASPLAFREGEARRTNFALSIAVASIVSFTVVTPPGFSQATVTAIGSAYKVNTTSSLDYLYTRCTVSAPSGGGSGVGLYTPLVASNGSGSLTVAQHAAFTGLAGGQLLTISLEGASEFAPLPASAVDRAAVSAAVIFAR